MMEEQKPDDPLLAWLRNDKQLRANENLKDCRQYSSKRPVSMSAVLPRLFQSVVCGR